MKLEELVEVKQLIAPNILDKKSTKKAPPPHIPNQYEDKDAGAKTKMGVLTATIKSTGTGKVYGRRSIRTKV